MNVNNIYIPKPSRLFVKRGANGESQFIFGCPRGLLEDRPPGSVVREAVLSDLELTERQKQMLIEIYESFRKETAIDRTADGAELLDDQTGLMPDEAALNWPEDIGPAALAARPRRLAIATSYTGADGDEGDYGEEEDDQGEAGEAFRFGRTPASDERGQGGTIHQFPPPAGTR